MRRIKLVLAVAGLMVAMTTASALPALADDNNFFDHHRFSPFFNDGSTLEFDQDIGNTGDVSLSTNVSQSGNNSNQCVAPLQFGNTGNLQNAQGFATFGTPFFNNNNDNNDNGFFRHRFFPFFDNGFNDVQFEGSTFEFSPTLTNTCDQSVEQAAAAG